MPFDVIVRPRFGDTARVASDEQCRPRLVADIGTGGTFSVLVDDEPGSTELAARFARELAAAALRFAEACEQSISTVGSTSSQKA
jgi:proline racemase